MKRTDTVSEYVRLTWNRRVGIAFAVGTQLMFLYSAVSLFYFLKEGSQSIGNAYVVTAILATLFALPHSVLLLPFVQRTMKQYVPGALRAACIVR